ncbi:MAG: ATP-binding protein [Desulfobacula sp.]|uniref:ATP-binding protein n=1 Tax=Desulfobacula sp. TaxID=2593537 RepID=UPI0025BDF81B|nr:ATP-binding protein [Desulfobacula sp.]MCD4718831.1 ATP-binding protein [Desulfobacula sp.]
MEPIHLSVMSHPKNLKHIRSMMADITLKTGLSKEDSGSIILAVDEACSNIIRHSYENDYNRKIDIAVILETNSLTISIIDDGIKFDINSIEPRDTSLLKPGGLGIYIIKQVMDTVEYSRTSKGFNKIKMVKKLLS